MPVLPQHGQNPCREIFGHNKTPLIGGGANRLLWTFLVVGVLVTLGGIVPHVVRLCSGEAAALGLLRRLGRRELADKPNPLPLLHIPSASRQKSYAPHIHCLQCG